MQMTLKGRTILMSTRPLSISVSRRSYVAEKLHFIARRFRFPMHQEAYSTCQVQFVLNTHMIFRPHQEFMCAR